MNLLKYVFRALIAFGVVSAAPALASVQGPGKVSEVHIMNGGTAIFNVSGTRTTQPSCSVTLSRWAFNATTPAGQAKLSFLLTAYTSGKTVEIHGTDTCADWGDTETVEYMRTID